MSSSGKKKVTATLLVAAGCALALALGLAAKQRTAVASRVTEKVSFTNPGEKPVKAIKAVKVVKKTVKVVERKVKPPEPPKVDVVFVLDTTGSMGGLISGAKKKIWSIANQIVSGQPRPDVRIGLVGYRDKGDTYVTRRFDLTENIDDTYAHLQRFRAQGGGDTPEHVNLALSDAMNKMSWRQGQDVLRLVFLVGDAPPHEGRDGLYSTKLASQAVGMGITLNAVRCGSSGATATAWNRIAKMSGGMYASIRQDGGMVAVRTPVDERLKDLNMELSGTILPTGSAVTKTAVRRRAAMNAAMAAEVQAESASYRATSGKLDSADLLAGLARGKDLDAYAEDELPAPVAAMPRAERKGYLKEVAQKRAKLKREITALSAKRSAYIKAKRPSSATPAFDDTIEAALKKQGKKIGVAY